MKHDWLKTADGIEDHFGGRGPTDRAFASYEAGKMLLTLADELADQDQRIAKLEAVIEQGIRFRTAITLLREWRQTPYFDSRAAWEKWVADFGDRVDQVIKEAPDAHD